MCLDLVCLLVVGCQITPVILILDLVGLTFYLGWYCFASLPVWFIVDNLVIVVLIP